MVSLIEMISRTELMYIYCCLSTVGAPRSGIAEPRETSDRPHITPRRNGKPGLCSRGAVRFLHVPCWVLACSSSSSWRWKVKWTSVVVGSSALICDLILIFFSFFFFQTPTIISVFFRVFTMCCLIMVIHIQDHDARPAEQPITRIVCFFIIDNHDFLLCFWSWQQRLYLN